MDINFEDFQNICRICATTGKLRPLHENNLNVLLEKITDLKVNEQNIQLFFKINI